jgi:hypothetical protein
MDGQLTRNVSPRKQANRNDVNSRTNNRLMLTINYGLML